MQKADLKKCKECQATQDLELHITKGNLAFSGFCGKSIIFKNYLRTEHDNKDCPRCPNFEDPVEHVEKVIADIKRKK